MILNKATILDFRNLAEVHLHLNNKVNIFIGNNGHGKTNLLEALNYPSLARSFRGNKDEELINFNSQTASLSIQATHNKIETHFQIGLNKEGTRKVTIDGDIIRKKVDMIGRLHTLVLDPQTVSLVRDAPAGRRRFLDVGLGTLSLEYVMHLQSCNRIVKQKNRLLKDFKKRVINRRELIDNMNAWNCELASHAAPIAESRISYCRELEPFATSIYSELASSNSELKLDFVSRFHNSEKEDKNSKLEQEILSILDYIIEDEIQRGRCLVGPQTDDIRVTLNKIDLRNYGSQGETRTAAIAMKLAQSEVIAKRKQIRPILFLDDIFSELDRDRSARFQELVAGKHQLLIATASIEDVEKWSPDNAKRWVVESGTVKELA